MPSRQQTKKTKTSQSKKTVFDLPKSIVEVDYNRPYESMIDSLGLPRAHVD